MPQDIALLVRNALYEKKMTQKELADMLSISTPYLSDIIRGKRDGDKAQEYVKRIKYILEIK